MIQRQPRLDPHKYDLPADYARLLLGYDPVTGDFVWRSNPERGAAWNAKWPGKLAGGLNRDYKRIRIRYNGKTRTYPASNLAHLIMTGCWPELEIDHKNLLKGDNRWDNLREGSSSQNKWNIAPPRDNATGFKGVNVSNGRYRARIQAGRIRRSLGDFDTAEEAAAAYSVAAKELHGSFARTE